MSSTEMKFVKFLGQGSYGSVHLYAQENDDGSVIYEAVKTSSVMNYKALDKEFRILTELKGCPRIVQLPENVDTLFEETDSKGNRIFMMSMEYAAGGSLLDLIRGSKKLSDSIIKDLTRMILQGLVSIHSHGYVHCDLKPENLLLFPRYNDENCSFDLKIADFGLSTKAGEQSDLWDFDDPWVGTPVYMSPESVQESIVKPDLDLWSLGCIVLQMYTGKYPWSGLGMYEVEYNLMGGQPPHIPKLTVPSDAREFIEKCFARKREDRGTASELLSHPFLKGDQEMAEETRQLKANGVTANKLKSIPPNPKQFKRISRKPRMRVLPPRCVCV